MRRCSMNRNNTSNNRTKYEKNKRENILQKSSRMVKIAKFTHDSDNGDLSTKVRKIYIRENILLHFIAMLRDISKYNIR